MNAAIHLKPSEGALSFSSERSAPLVNCKKCGREIFLVRSKYGQWFAYDSIHPSFQAHRHGSDAYELPDHDRVPLFNPKENKYKK